MFSVLVSGRRATATASWTPCGARASRPAPFVHPLHTLPPYVDATGASGSRWRRPSPAPASTCRRGRVDPRPGAAACATSCSSAWPWRRRRDRRPGGRPPDRRWAAVRVVVLDRDGTINVERHYLADPGPGRADRRRRRGTAAPARPGAGADRDHEPIGRGARILHRGHAGGDPRPAGRVPGRRGRRAGRHLRLPARPRRRVPVPQAGHRRCSSRPRGSGASTRARRS